MEQEEAGTALGEAAADTRGLPEGWMHLQHEGQTLYVCHAKKIFSTTHPVDLAAAAATSVIPAHGHKPSPCVLGNRICAWP